MVATKLEKSFVTVPVSPSLRIAAHGDQAVRANPHDLLDRIMGRSAKADAKPAMRRYPGVVRIAIPVIGSVVLWAAIIWGATTLL